MIKFMNIKVTWPQTISPQTRLESLNDAQFDKEIFSRQYFTTFWKLQYFHRILTFAFSSGNSSLAFHLKLIQDFFALSMDKGTLITAAAANYICRKLHHRYSTGLWVRLWVGATELMFFLLVCLDLSG